MDIAIKVKSLIEPIIVENNYKLVDVEYVLEETTYFLRVIIDKSGIMDVEDCVKIFNLISPLLDEADFISNSYILDVCSKGRGSDKDE